MRLRVSTPTRSPARLAGLNISGRDFAGLFNTGQFAGLGLFDEWEYETIPGKPGKPAVYAPDKPPENNVTWVATPTAPPIWVNLV